MPHVVNELWPIRPHRSDVLDRSWENEHAFDATWEYQPSVPDVPAIGGFAKMLARLIYNPRVGVTGEWKPVAKYDPAKVLALVEEGLKHDDDCIQQWFEAEEVMQLLRAADSFATMVLAVRSICGEFEVNDLARQYVKQALGHDPCAD